MSPTGKATKRKRHGLEKVTPAMWKHLRQIVNARNHKDLTALDPMNLYRRFFNEDEKLGQWGISLSTSAWYAGLHREGFIIRKPYFAPLLSQQHIADRLTYAESEVRILDNQVDTPIPQYARRIISMDAAKFSVKYNSSYGCNTLRIVMDKKKRVEHFFGQLNRATSYEAYGAICWGDRTDLTFTMEQDPTKVSHPTATHVKEFIEQQVVPMAERLRQRLGLAPTANLFILLDGAGVHKAKRVLNILEDNNIVSAGLAPKCPECQPIESGWFMTKTALARLPMEKHHRSDPHAFFSFLLASTSLPSSK